MAPTRTRASHSASDSQAGETSLEVLGRRLTRMHEMFYCTTSLLNLGKETHGMDKQARTQFCQGSEKKQRLLGVLEALLALDPTVIQRTLTAPLDLRRVVNRDTGKSLSRGQSNGRSEDMRKMIKLMNDERVWSWGPLPGSIRCKGARGLNHEGCAYLLSPPSLDWEDQEVRANFLAGKTRPSGQQWPRLCWMGCEYNPAKPSEGLLYSDLLIEGGKGMLLSLSSVDNIAGAPGARGSGAKRKNNKGLAKRYNINRVTTSFIAYVVVCIRHALTSDTLFDEVSNGFNYPAFYDGIKQYLEAPSFASRATALLDWWNQKIFGDVYFGAEEPQDPQGCGTLAALLAEVEGEDDRGTPGSGVGEDAGDESS
ncbi:hypothetical protein RSOLAG22IIIB_11995 [Rhizoctonia solani]|uniref:Uncharacterized protein n=1 Tax=Rhizoctonia solani TaxID=456999 RepID=A0A0K6GBC0_9AGAM|nr:hypothetical protein RSOLAG22IIIB_11995 [Rhizoctonia solani]